MNCPDLKRKLESGEHGPSKRYFYNMYSGKEDLSTEEYYNIVNTFYKLFTKATIETGFMYKLPKKLGALGIRKRKQRAYTLGTVDWIETRKTGKLTRYTNTHTAGWYAKVLWDKQQPHGLFRDKGLYHFKPSRVYKNELFKGIVDNNLMYKYYIVDAIHETINDEE